MRTRRRRTGRLLAAGGLLFLALLPAAAADAAGPPFPPPEEGRAVYDTAEVLQRDTRERAESVIDAIEERTGAEVVVYTQLVPFGVSTEEAELHAQALIDQWGVGRRGFDDGLAILFDLHENDPCHGQVQLYAGPGYRAAFLSNPERQAIYENDMLPRLRACDLDGALLVALERVDANATPEHAAVLASARQLNAVLGLLGAPIAFLLILAWGAWSWLRFGRDPVYLDDPSIHMPAPPAGLTPASGALVRDGRTSRRALTAASLDLASRGYVAFEAEDHKGHKLAISTAERRPVDPVDEAHLALARRRTLDPATALLRTKLGSIAGRDDRIASDDLLKLGSHVGEFNKRLEAYVVQQGWFTEPPARAIGRWLGRGVGFAILGAIVAFAGANLPSDGIVLVGAGVIAGGVTLMLLAAGMPARTMPGAMVRAMLEAYRRTLDRTMAQARSMEQVVSESAIPLIEDPDDAVAWGVALGLQGEVERVLSRTADDRRAGTTTGYLPAWYGGAASASGPRGGGSGGWAPGLMSSSPIPNFGGMMAALSTIGNSPSSSGSGGGGFSGGGSGGGGGGAGGGF